jgi:hypothetical protein
VLLHLNNEAIRPFARWPNLHGNKSAKFKSKNPNEKKRHCISRIRNAPQNARGSKTSDEKRGIVFHELETHPKNTMVSKTSDERRGTTFHK